MNSVRSARGILLLLVVLIAAPLDSQPPVFLQVAEAASAQSSEGGMRVEYRIFSLASFRKACAERVRPSTLVFEGDPLVLTVGSWFPLRRLVVVARDDSGRRLAGVPIAIEVEAGSRSLIDLRPEMISESRLLPVRAGEFRFRARTFCPGPMVESTIQARIWNR
jgi:hypothetical protein